jgi:CheY-like chemotaxis protein
MNTAPVLYVEDDDNDAFLLQRAFRQAEIPNPLIILPHGDAALAYMSGTGAYENRAENPLPGLVILDLNMPGKNGFEVLRWMRQNRLCPGLPVVVLTSSHQEGDIGRAYAEGANGFLVKPNKPDELFAMVKALRDFWLLHNRAPASVSRKLAGA